MRDLEGGGQQSGITCYVVISGDLHFREENWGFYLGGNVTFGGFTIDIEVSIYDPDQNGIVAPLGRLVRRVLEAINVEGKGGVKGTFGVTLATEFSQGDVDGVVLLGHVTRLDLGVIGCLTTGNAGCAFPGHLLHRDMHIDIAILLHFEAHRVHRYR